MGVETQPERKINPIRGYHPFDQYPDVSQNRLAYLWALQRNTDKQCREAYFRETECGQYLDRYESGCNVCALGALAIAFPDVVKSGTQTGTSTCASLVGDFLIDVVSWNDEKMLSFPEIAARLMSEWSITQDEIDVYGASQEHAPTLEG